ncbi:hypothetical protein [Natrarchaeobaculum sulfurireducens]|uniref:Uncharacterized protein n=1 Tax=Natrarchaeobaculum sulfurireducens TaxID=2044521 RepID=A0A346PN82_9EURY|nr:hypothetical protein [Natrarchaeobaculum sulfurireducens]AXR80977.1 hypothetical protein AArcMg_0959 [Natrarchaeobaculum sulfurireducens]
MPATVSTAAGSQFVDAVDAAGSTVLIQEIDDTDLDRFAWTILREDDVDHALEARAVAGRDVVTDGGEPTDDHPRTPDTQTMTDDTDIQVGDVCIDLAQGRPVHVIERYDGDAREWSDENNYEIAENYGNSRLGATNSDAVFECVYCSNIKSKPSKSYAFPESRLARVETEQADGGRPVYDRIVSEVLEQLFVRAAEDDEAAVEVLERYAKDASAQLDSTIAIGAVHEARELAEVEATIGGDD